MILCIFSCTQDPKTKLYNEETVQEDIVGFTQEEKTINNDIYTQSLCLVSLNTSN